MSETLALEANSELSEVVHRAVESGEEVYLTEGGRRMGRIVPEAPATSLERESEWEEARRRLAEAGLLADVTPLEHPGPSEEEFRAAAASVGRRGRPVSDYVIDGR